MSWLAWRLRRVNAIRLGRVRHRPGLEVCEADAHVWVRAENPTEELRAELAGFADVEFTALADDQLIERGKRVPHDYLPKEQWLPLAQWMQVELGTAALGATPTKVPVQCVRSDVVESPNVILAEFADWHAYAIFAPQVRLDRLAFAVSDTQWVVVRGEPVPPIRGVRFVEQSGIAVEAGWTWQPAVAANVLATAMRIAPGDLALVHADGGWDHIRENDFVRASRAAARRSAEELAHGQ